jgi:hypothetical protein
MIDFTVRTADQQVGGLNMGLCPAECTGKERQEAIYIAECAFSFLEPSIRKSSPDYTRSYSHWGHTTISRAEWHVIIEDWARLRSNFSGATTIAEVAGFCSMSEKLKDEFNKAFEVNKIGVLSLIDQIVDWLHPKLIAYDHISVLGI